MILDFPGPGRNRDRVVFTAPRRVISAASLDAVRPALREAGQAAQAGAWVAGFVGYEAAAAFDHALVSRPHEGPAPLLWFGVFGEPRKTSAPAAATAVPSPAWQPDVSRGEYDAAIERIRSAIAAGSVYQVNYTFRLRASCDIAPAALYDALVAGGHGVYHALIETPEWAIVSASPELFFHVEDGSVTTRPMKGTARRGRWPEEDSAAARALAMSAKDRAENLMIVDLLRNDLGRIARFGSVTVTDMFDVATYPTVHQMTSTITARLRDDVAVDDIFAAMFPCGSVTGAPKVAAMQHIADLEMSPRGVYCGAIGVLRPDATATFSVAIRTVVMNTAARTAMYGAGGGITWDSSAPAEYSEANAKAALLDEQPRGFDLVETMRLENGTLSRFDLHLARLAASAAYWGFADGTVAAAALALERERTVAPDGAWRIRLTAARDATIHITRTPLAEPGGRLQGLADSSREQNVRRVALAREPVDSRDRLLYHKTTARAIYDDRRAAQPDAFDVLLYNQCGCITEFTTGNVVCDIDGRLLTPPREAGLLAGTFRAQLLNEGLLHEQNVRLDELERAKRMWLINSVREFVPVELHERKKGQSR